MLRGFFIIEGLRLISSKTIASKSKKQLYIAEIVYFNIYRGTSVPYLYLAMKLLKCFGKT